MLLAHGLRRRRCTAAAAALLLCLFAVAPARAFTRLVVFGDSLSDTGNIYAITSNPVIQTLAGGLFDLPMPYPPPPYYNHRFSDGPVWIDHLAADLGLSSPTHDLNAGFFWPSTGNGTNYAVGGALTSGSDLPFVDMDEQLPRYLDDGPSTTGNELFVVFGGANNVNDSQTDVGAIAGELIGYIDDLYAAGARHVLVSNLPPIGQTPGNRGTSDEALRDNLSIQFNAAYAAALDALAPARPGLVLYRMDFFGLTEALLDEPALYGFTNITDPALDEDTLTVDPNYDDDYAFWDEIHPTARFHRLIADAARVAVVGPLTGDANYDGLVDALDARFVEQFFGKTAAAGGLLPGDANGDGRVDGDDYLAVERHFGAQWSAAPTPEPVCIVLLPAAITLLRRRSDVASR